MGNLSQMFAAFIFIIAMMAVFALLYHDSGAQTLFPNSALPDSFNKTDQYGQYMSNQSNNFQNQIQSQGANPNPLLVGTLILSAGSTAAISMVSIGVIGMALVNDFGVLLMIPLFFTGLLITWMTYKIGAQIIRAIRLGDM